MGITAENLAEKYSISRTEQDEFALRSQEMPNAPLLPGCLKSKLYLVKREYINEKGEKVLISRSTVIERH